MQIMKIREFHERIMKIIEILKNQLENNTNHEHLKISYENHENYENPGIPFENNENHEKKIEFHARIMKIMIILTSIPNVMLCS